MNIAAIEDALVTWATSVATTSAVYLREPKGPRPEPPAVRLKLIIGPARVGLDELRDVAGDPNAFQIVGPRTLTLSVTTYGDTALQVASDLITSLSDPASIAALEAGGVSSLGTSDPRDVSAALETQFEQRCNFDVELLATEQTTVVPGVIEEITASGTVTGTKSGVPITFPLSIDKTP